MKQKIALKEFTQLCYEAHLETYINDGSLGNSFEALPNTVFKMCMQTYSNNLHRLIYGSIK